MSFRDMSVPYSDAELEALRVSFEALPTYSDGAIQAADIPALIVAMKYERTPEQVQAYQQYWQEQCGGSVSWEEFVSSAKSVHKTSSYARDYVVKADTDNDGYISAEEFRPLLDLLVLHDQTLAGVTFDNFVDEADVNADGLVSVEECVSWVEKNSRN